MRGAAGGSTDEADAEADEARALAETRTLIAGLLETDLTTALQRARHAVGFSSGLRFIRRSRLVRRARRLYRTARKKLSKVRACLRGRHSQSSLSTSLSFSPSTLSLSSSGLYFSRVSPAKNASNARASLRSDRTFRNGVRAAPLIIDFLNFCSPRLILFRSSLRSCLFSRHTSRSENLNFHCHDSPLIMNHCTVVVVVVEVT